MEKEQAAGRPVTEEGNSEAESNDKGKGRAEDSGSTGDEEEEEGEVGEATLGKA